MDGVESISFYEFLKLKLKNMAMHIFPSCKVLEQYLNDICIFSCAAIETGRP